ncbi:MAG: Hsp20/alpha crystallin family protein [Desulfovibrionaceae bacterium]|nr:Hsp20/alpha crystallin family protein [Desulfovibrionaceae bacterium]
MYSAESEFYRRENIPFPSINLSESPDAIHVRALMPGVRASHLQLTLGEQALIIEGELPPLPGRYYRQERFSGPFRRVVMLSAPARRDAATVFLRNGVLEVSLPKQPAGRPQPFRSAAGQPGARAQNPVQRCRIRPAADIVERPDGILALVNLPGVAPEDLLVETDHRHLCIWGARRGSGCDPRGASVLALEFVNREYEIKIALSPAQDIENIAARLRNGVLSVLLPRRRAPVPRAIPVSADED